MNGLELSEKLAGMTTVELRNVYRKAAAELGIRTVAVFAGLFTISEATGLLARLQ